MSKIYDNMPFVIDPRQLLVNLLRSKGIFIAMLPQAIKQQKIELDSSCYDQIPKAGMLKTGTKVSATPIRKFENGHTYFMPVSMYSPSLGDIEIPIAAISIKGRKTIVETPLVGRSGSVKELISIDDYEVSIDGVIMSEDRNYPEDGVQQIAELFNLNSSVELICAVSDLVIGVGTQIVIKTIEWPKVGGVENMQTFSLTAVTDASVELEIK